MVSIKSVEFEFQSHHFLYIVVLIGIGLVLVATYQSYMDIPSVGITIHDFTDISRLWGSWEGQIISAFEEFTNNEFFKQLGVVITFLYSMTPSLIPIPNELFMTPLVLAEPTHEEQFNQVIFLIVLTSIGGFIGDSLMFLGAKYHIHKIFKSEKLDDMDSNHWFHKFGIVIFLFTPSLWFAGGLAELALAIAGYAQVDFKKIAPFIFAGNFIRGIWGGIIFLSVLGLL